MQHCVGSGVFTPNTHSSGGTSILDVTASKDRMNDWSTAKGNTYYTYDGVGNLTFINYPSSTDVTMQYDLLNRLTNMVDASETTKYTYTAGNQLLTEDGPFTSDVVTNAYSNRLRTKLSLQQPTGVWTNLFVYDLAAHLTNVTSPAGGFSYTLGASSPGSRLVKRIGLPNTSYITNTFDTVGRLTGTYLDNNSGTVLDSAVYGYNKASQRTAFTNGAGTYYQFIYDNIGQLVVADSSVNTEDRGYFYDSAWNLNRRTNNGTASTFSVGTKNQLTNWPSGSFTYDGNGNMLSQNTAAINNVYDDENRLTSSENDDKHTWRTDFVYDGLGRLRKRIEYNWSGSGWISSYEIHYIYDGWRVIQERDINNTPLVSYTRGTDLSGTMEGAGGIGGLLARSFGYSSGNWSTHDFYHADGNGNVTYLEDSSQSLAASYRYDPFGNTLSSSGTLATTNVYRFSSKEFMVNSARYYYGYRLYDPNLQRWLNRDPIGELGGIGLYGFVSNDPLDRYDPFGEADAPKDQPPVTSPPIFGGKPFKPGKDNCLCYALDRPGGELQPDGGYGDKNGKNCKDLLAQLKKNYPGTSDVPKGGNCPAGSHRISVFSDPNGGYHTQRQDSDGGWSEMGLNNPETYPPRKCKRGSSGKDCGDLCAPDQPKSPTPLPSR